MTWDQLREQSGYDDNGVPKVLEPNLSLLEQFEESAVESDLASEWLMNEIYPNPQFMSVLDNTKGPRDLP